MYPIYVPSRGRCDTGTTMRLLLNAGLSPTVVVEPRERDAYAARFGADRVLTLSADNHPLRLSFSRNSIKAVAAERGERYHWQVDDDMRAFLRREPVAGRERGRMVRCSPAEALGFAESVMDAYSNIWQVGFTTSAFPNWDHDLLVNRQCPSCVLFATATVARWRMSRGPEDTDYSLQLLSSGLCTILVATYAFDSAPSESGGGGLTDAYNGAGRLSGVRELQRRWPGLVGEPVVRRGRVGAGTQATWRRFTQRPIPVANDQRVD